MASPMISFAEFFTALHKHPPFRWQEELVDYIIHHERWPQLIAAPTGSGKSSVIDVHLYVNAFAGNLAISIPRRLVMTVNRRSLVDDHAEHAYSLQQKLLNATAGSTLHMMHEQLKVRSGGPDFFPVHTIRGGQQLGTDWRTNPLATQFIAATPDMWGSRVLFRGYGTSRYARPIEAGLLTRDTVLVVDEAHMNQQLVHMARSIAELEQKTSTLTGSPLFQVVETTATPAIDYEPSNSIQVEEAHLTQSETLRRRLTLPKMVHLAEVKTRRADNKNVAKAFVAHLIAQRERYQGVERPVGCIVNTVQLALEIARQLRDELKIMDDDRRVALFIGTQRLYDRAVLRSELPALFTTTGEAQVEFIVATQTLEVGVDIDLAALVTELAPGNALAQRSGRVNRIGARDESAIVVVKPQYAKNNTGVPYEFDDLEQAWDWLQTLPESGITPWELLKNPAPTQTATRLLYQSVSWGDALYFGRSSDDLAAADTSIPSHGEDLTLWLRDSFSDSGEVGIVARDFLTGDSLFDANTLGITPPIAEEIYPVRLSRARNIAEEVLATNEGSLETLHIVRSDEVLTVQDSQAIRAGDTLIIPTSQPVFLSGIPHPEGTQFGTDVLERAAALAAPNEIYRRFFVPPEDVARFEAVTHLAAVAETGDSEQYNNAMRAVVEALLESDTEIALHHSSRWNIEIVPPLRAGQPMFCVIKTVPLVESEAQQTYAPRPVLLSHHQQAVAKRVDEYVKHLGITRTRTSLFTAAKYHDEGKRDQRFQLYLRGGRTGSEPLAKSTRAFNWNQYVAYGLQSWRHEQLSAASWQFQHEASDENNIDELLITWLIGTSHGRGRATFTMCTDALFPEGSEVPEQVLENARALFDDGGWDDLYESLNKRYGPWGLAYLESLVRIADQQVSREGS